MSETKTKSKPSTEEVQESVESVVIETAVEKINKGLVKPKIGVFTGAIESFTFKNANSSSGGKFEKDTYILSLSVPVKDENGIRFDQHICFLTASQYKEYGMKNILYLGNYVKLMVEHNIEGKTGYKESSEDDFLTPHEKTFDSFNGAVEATLDVLYLMFDSMGISERISERIVNGVMKTREVQAMRSGNTVTPF